MRTVAYCRVSTNKDEQLDSLATQQTFFTEYSKKNNFNLVKIYADEGKSGTKMKNRTALLKLLADAQQGLFDVVLIKDVSRLARNTVDFLTSIRRLKSLNVQVIFVNYDQTTSESSEFMLTMLSAIAQEESANTSKRVKFGKKMNSEKGRVPNFCYGYDKIQGDYFNLNINEEEAKVVREIFDMYVNRNMGANKIAKELISKGMKTKRNCNFSQNAVARILANEIYVGKIINGKEEVEDFLTGERKTVPREQWVVVQNEDLRLIDDDTFNKAQIILENNKNRFNITSERNSQKHIFSKLIKCDCCGYSFRRSVRKYKNTYVRWICSGRNANGVEACKNKTIIDEDEMIKAIKDYFVEILKDKTKLKNDLVKRFEKKYKSKDENVLSEKELNKKLDKLKKDKDKYIEMFKNDIISMDELRTNTDEINKMIGEIDEALSFISLNISKGNLLDNYIKEAFNDMEKFLKDVNFDNSTLARIIECILVDEEGNVGVYFKLINEIGLES